MNDVNWDKAVISNDVAVYRLSARLDDQLIFAIAPNEQDGTQSGQGW